MIELVLVVVLASVGIMASVLCILELYWEHQEYKEKTKNYFDKHNIKYSDGDNT